jgi:NAD(P)-dependent dehydrogenase (short-subunit alcohol dehydrogenase family)
MKAVVITGASTGIGKATALRLSQAGFTVFACVRRETHAAVLQQEMNVKTLLLDVTNETQIREAAETVRERVGDNGLAGLVNNAGLAVAGPLEFLPVSEVRKQFETNVFGQLAVTQAFLPLLRRGSGRVVMMSSVSGRVASPMTGPYASSKFALEGLSDSLRRELAPWKLHVAIIEPGRVITPIWEKSLQAANKSLENLAPEANRLYAPLIASTRASGARAIKEGIASDEVAKAVLHALVAERPKTRYVVGPDARLGSLLARLLPDRMLDWLLSR